MLPPRFTPISLSLWRLMTRPQLPTIPLSRVLAAQRALKLGDPLDKRLRRQWQTLSIYFPCLALNIFGLSVLCAAVVMCGGYWFYNINAIFGFLLSTVAGALPLFLIFNGTITGSRWLMRILNTAYSIHDPVFLGLLWLLPSGKQGFLYALLGSYTEQSKRLKNNLDLIVAFCIFVMVTSFGWVFAPGKTPGSLTLLAILNALVLAFCLDYAYSALLGFLIASINSIRGAKRQQTTLRALAVYLLIKLAIMLLVAIAVVVFALGLQGNITSWLTPLQPLLILVAFAALHELAVALLWRALAVELGVSLNEFSAQRGVS